MNSGLHKVTPFRFGFSTRVLFGVQYIRPTPTFFPIQQVLYRIIDLVVKNIPKFSRLECSRYMYGYKCISNQERFRVRIGPQWSSCLSYEETGVTHRCGKIKTIYVQSSKALTAKRGPKSCSRSLAMLLSPFLGHQTTFNHPTYQPTKY